MGKKGILTNHSTRRAHTEAVPDVMERSERRMFHWHAIGSDGVTGDQSELCGNIDGGCSFFPQQGIESDDSLNPGNFKALMKLLSRH